MAVTPANKVTGAARAAAPARTRTLWADAWGRLKRNKVAVAGAVILVVIALIAIIYPVIDPEGYLKTVRDPVTHRTIQNQFPSLAHPFGTDSQSRDVFARVLYGARISLSVGLISEFIILFIGVPLGLIAGYFGRGVDQILM